MNAKRFAKAIGSRLEDEVENRLELLLQQGIIGWYQRNEPGLVRGRGRGGWTQAEPAGADFSGTIVGGRSFAIECKSCDGLEPFQYTRLLHTKGEKKGQKKRQLLHLEAEARAGGLGLLLVEWRPEASPWLTALIPIEVCPWRVRVTNRVLDPVTVHPQWKANKANLLAPFLERV